MAIEFLRGFILSKLAATTATGLASGELAANLAGHRLFLGDGAPDGYPLGGQRYPMPVPPSNVVFIVGDTGCTALSTQALTAARQIWVPMMVPRPISLTGLRIAVTTASAGSASVGLYGNTVVSGKDQPGSLLASATGLNTGSTGDKDGTFASAYALQPGTLYWASMIASVAATVRAVPIANVQASLGRQPASNQANLYFFAAGSGSTLASPAPTSLTSTGTGLLPAIYLLES